MNAITLDPSKIANQQVIAVPQTRTGTEIWLVGKFNASAGQGLEVSVYLDYISAKTKLKLIESTSATINVAQSHKINLPPADRYIFQSSNFQGMIFGDFETNPVSSNLSAGATELVIGLPLNFVGVTLGGSYISDANGSTIDFTTDYTKFGQCVLNLSMQVTEPATADEKMVMQHSTDNVTWENMPHSQYCEYNGDSFDTALIDNSWGNSTEDMLFFVVVFQPTRRYFRVNYDAGGGDGEYSIAASVLKG